MSKKETTVVDLEADYKNLENQIRDFIDKRRESEQEIKYTASIFLKWLKTKTEIVDNEGNFSIPEGKELKRGTVVWIDFGFNIGDEFGGKHPAIIIRVSGAKVFVVPLSSQTPKNKEKKQYVKVDRVFEFPYKTRWVNVLNLIGVSVQRIDFDSKFGRVNGRILDKISNAISEVGIK